MRYWRHWATFVTTVLLVITAIVLNGCSAESPTAPPPFHHHHEHEAPPEPEKTCDLPPAEHAGWRSPFHGTSSKKDVIEAAKVAVGERCGAHPLDTLQLLVDELLSKGECAGISVDGIFIKADDNPGRGGFWDEFHSVEWKHGCYTGHRAYIGTWFHTGSD